MIAVISGHKGIVVLGWRRFQGEGYRFRVRGTDSGLRDKEASALDFVATHLLSDSEGLSLRVQGPK